MLAILPGTCNRFRQLLERRGLSLFVGLHVQLLPLALTVLRVAQAESGVG